MKNILVLLVLMGTFQLSAQTTTDAIRYSYLEVGGTARTVGVGGAIGALGADYSVLSTNPAGLAAFRTNEFILTPGIYISKTTSTLENDPNNTPVVESSGRFNFNNIGMVFNNRPRGKWTTFNIGIGYNRLATFNQEFSFKGVSEGSIVERFTELANDGIFDDFEGGLADLAFAVYDLDGDGFYENDFDEKPGYVDQKEQLVKTKGSYSEMVFSLAGNYDEKLMIGATIGVPFIKYEEEKIYKEEDVDDVPFFNNLSFREDLTTSGIGINLKVGVIYRLNQMFRFGIAAHTPTVMALTDNFSTELIYDYTDAGGTFNDPQRSPDGTFDYGLKTPWRVMGSAAVLFNKIGFLSADLEVIDYSLSDFNLTKNSTTTEDKDYERSLNNDISTQFEQTVNFRLGGEYAYEKFRFRLGYTISGTPYADDNITNNTYSLGVGIRENNFYADLAYKNSKVDEGYIPYLMSDERVEIEQFVTNEVSSSQFLLTLGFKF